MISDASRFRPFVEGAGSLRCLLVFKLSFSCLFHFCLLLLRSSFKGCLAVHHRSRCLLNYVHFLPLFLPSLFLHCACQPVLIATKVWLFCFDFSLAIFLRDILAACFIHAFWLIFSHSSFSSSHSSAAFHLSTDG